MKFSIRPEKDSTFVRTSKHSRTQQLLAKATDHIKQILKHVRHALFLKTAQNQKPSENYNTACMGRPQRKNQAKSLVCFRKKPLQKRKEKRAKLCRFITTAWASLLQVEGKTKCERTSSSYNCLPEYKKIATYLAKQG